MGPKRRIIEEEIEWSVHPVLREGNSRSPPLVVTRATRTSSRETRISPRKTPNKSTRRSSPSKVSPKIVRITQEELPVKPVVKIPYMKSDEFKLEKEYDEMRGLLEETEEMVSECGMDLAEAGYYEKSQAMLEVLKDVFRLKEAVKAKRIILNDLEGAVRLADRPEEIASLVENFQSLAGKDLVDEAGVIDWRQVPKIKEYNELTWEIGPGFGNRQAYPPIKLDRSSLMEESLEEDLVMQTRDSLICPISQLLLVNPVQNPGCKHIYSRASVEGLMSYSSVIQCPVSGCQKTVSRASLIPHKGIEMKLKIVENRIFK